MTLEQAEQLRQTWLRRYGPVPKFVDESTFQEAVEKAVMKVLRQYEGKCPICGARTASNLEMKDSTTAQP